jgi:hypothetical protein
MSEPQTYYARNHTKWGDSIEVLDWSNGRICGWLDRTPRVGDVIVFPMKSGREQETIVTEVKPFFDPPDMFSATVRPVEETA